MFTCMLCVVCLLVCFVSYSQGARRCEASGKSTGDIILLALLTPSCHP